MILDENIEFMNPTSEFFTDSQRDYERNIRVRDSKAIQDPKVKARYEKIKTLEKWFRDYRSSFTEQKKTIDLLKGYDFNIDAIMSTDIKDKYMRYNKRHRKTYQNMIIIFLAIIWMEIKDTTHHRVEQFIEVCNELGHKINKKMLNNAMLKIKKAEAKKLKHLKTDIDIETKIKEQIKILFQRYLNEIPFELIKEQIQDPEEYEKIKIEMQLRADQLLKKMSYKQIQNLNYKAFTAGLVYYIGQTLDNKDNRKIFTQSIVEKTTKFSSTTIRRKYHILIEILGDPKRI